MHSLYENRQIGFFDLLGFSKLLETRPIADLHQEYAALIDEANTAIFQSQPDGTRNFEKTQFLFDSLVLVSHSLEPKAVGNFIFATLQIMERSFECGFYLRGCIAMGDFLDDPSR